MLNKNFSYLSLPNPFHFVINFATHTDIHVQLYHIYVGLVMPGNHTEPECVKDKVS